MPVTADSSLTADSGCWTADGRIICIDAGVVEAAVALDQFDAAAIADTTIDIVDAVRIAAADVVEVANALDDTDAIAVTGGAIIPVDVVEAVAALDQLDAAVFPEIVAAPGGAHYPQRRPLPVYGTGYGILPELWGEAHGVVGAVAKGAAQLVVRATAVGACGQAGNAAVVLKALSVAGKGAVGARGAGEGVIMKFSGSATGRHDDDEAAVIAILLAA